LFLPPENYFSSPAINRVEAMMHKVFARNRVSGEWFEFETEREVLSAIKKAKALSAEVVAQIPTFTKATKLGQSQENGKTIKATAVAKELIEVIAVSRAKRSSLLEIADQISTKLKSAINDGVNVQGAATEVKVTRKGKFLLDLLIEEDPKTYRKYLLTSLSMSARFTPKVAKLSLEELDLSFQKLVEKLHSRVKEAGIKDFQALNQVQLIITDEIASAEWDEEFALAELKIACGRNQAIEGICTWKRMLVEKETFDEKSFKLENPKKYEKYLEQPKTTSYIKITKRKV
jgi:hypothetical protein